jgi:hypothetical protein
MLSRLIETSTCDNPKYSTYKTRSDFRLASCAKSPVTAFEPVPCTFAGSQLLTSRTSRNVRFPMAAGTLPTNPMCVRFLCKKEKWFGHNNAGIIPFRVYLNFKVHIKSLSTLWPISPSRKATASRYVYRIMSSISTTDGIKKNEKKLRTMITLKQIFLNWTMTTFELHWLQNSLSNQLMRLSPNLSIGRWRQLQGDDVVA